MLNRVFTTFLTYFAVYAGLIVSFFLGFMTIFPLEKNSNSFPENTWQMFAKTFIMFTGEQEFMNFPFDNKTSTFTFIEVLFFFMFVMMTTLILLNLLGGLAVSDAGDMLAAAKTDMLYSLLGTSAFFDRMLQNNKRKDKKKQDPVCRKCLSFKSKHCPEVSMERCGRELEKRVEEEEDSVDCILRDIMRLVPKCKKEKKSENEKKIICSEGDYQQNHLMIPFEAKDNYDGYDYEEPMHKLTNFHISHELF